MSQYSCDKFSPNTVEKNQHEIAFFLNRRSINLESYSRNENVLHIMKRCETVIMLVNLIF
jgi:hypothetical protein